MIVFHRDPGASIVPPRSIKQSAPYQSRFRCRMELRGRMLLLGGRTKRCGWYGALATLKESQREMQSLLPHYYPNLFHLDTESGYCTVLSGLCMIPWEPLSL